MMIYIHLQGNLTSKETLKSKKAYEEFRGGKEVRIRHFHAENEQFAYNVFIQSVKETGLTIPYFGVKSHLQNRIAENRIRDLQEQARK